MKQPDDLTSENAPEKTIPSNKTVGETDDSRGKITDDIPAREARGNNADKARENGGGGDKGGGKGGAGAIIKKVLTFIFIDGLSGMASGLFATLIIGTIVCQIGSYISGSFGYYVRAVGSFAKVMMGAGVGVGVSLRLKKSPLVTVSAGVSGMIGAFASKIIARTALNEAMTVTTLASVGEPLGAFIAAMAAIGAGTLVSGKTKVDIIITPLVAIAAGSVGGLLLGSPIAGFMTAIGEVINRAATVQPVLMGIIIAVIMGVCLTLPISSAAIGVSLSLGGVAAGAAVAGCCCHMVGYAVISFKENGFGGLIAQGLGTSMLQMPNLVRRPACWIPPVVASAILGPIAAAALKITCTPVGSGMGTSGLVGVIETFGSISPSLGMAKSLLLVALVCFILPAALNLAVYFPLKKFGIIKDGDLELDL